MDSYMGQEETFKMLKELGGIATTKEVRHLTRRKYPNSSLDTNVLLYLNRLKKWKVVGQKDGKWCIITKSKVSNNV